MIREPNKPLKWHGRRIAFRFTRYYARGGTKVEIMDLSNWEHLCTATIEHLAGVKLSRDEVLINDINECYGLADLLKRAGIVIQTGTIIEGHGYRAYLCKLSGNAAPRATRTQGKLL